MSNQTAHWLTVLLFALSLTSCATIGEDEVEPGAAFVAQPTPSREVEHARAARWHGWRGPRRDGAAGGFVLPDALPQGSWPELWRVHVGEGLSGPIADGGRVFCHSRRGENEVASAHDARSGAVLWEHAAEVAAWSQPFEAWAIPPGPLATPALSDGLLYTVGIHGLVRCLEAASGRLVFAVTPESLHGRASNPRYGHASSPLVHDGRLFVAFVLGDDAEAPAGGITALDARTGRLLWGALREPVTYTSPVVARIHGAEHLVVRTWERLVGLDPASGRELWSHAPRAAGMQRDCATPLVAGDVVYVTNNAHGTFAVQVRPTDSGLKAVRLWRSGGLAAKTASPVVHDGQLYGLHQSGRFTCVDAASGRRRWVARAFGDHLSLLQFDDRALALDEEGRLELLRLSPSGFESLGAWKAGSYTWAQPGIDAEGLYIRDGEDVVCLPLGEVDSRQSTLDSRQSTVQRRREVQRQRDHCGSGLDRYSGAGASERLSLLRLLTVDCQLSTVDSPSPRLHSRTTSANWRLARRLLGRRFALSQRATEDTMSQKAPVAEPESELTIDTSKMSEGKRLALEVAEAARETTWKHPSFVGELFLGRFRDDLLLPYPLQDAEDAARGDEFIAKLREVLRDKVDGDQIDKDGEIPDDAIEALARLGAFGIKIPKDYGGLGLTQMNYSRAMMYVSSHCGNTSALLSAHQSIGLPQPLKLFGTEEQKRKYFPRLAAGEISAFALTETSVGSDPARMDTKAVPTPDGKHFILNGDKLWCTNGTRAGLFVVMAQTPSKIVRGKERSQITAFIVERDMPGVEVAYRCRFMGLKALYNGVIRFRDVKVPRENILFEEGKGLRLALTTLNTGRLTLPAACTGGAKRCLRMAREFARERVQWGGPIGKHEAIARKIAFIASHTFAMEAISFYSAILVDKGDADIRLEAAMCKQFCSECFWQIASETLQIRSGRGYETAESLRGRGEPGVPIERALRDSRINMIFEGTSEIMRLFISREALDPHLTRAGAVLNPKAPLSAKLADGLKAGLFYLGWYPKLWNPFPRGIQVHRRLAPHLAFVELASRKLARSLFHAMARYQAALEKKQALLSRFVEVGCELFAMAAACARADALATRHGDRCQGVIELADLFCLDSRVRVKELFRNIRRNHDRETYRLAQRVLEGEYAWLEEGAVEFPFE
jgi:hypothetical protein